jgi:hypothetical protein
MGGEALAELFICEETAGFDFDPISLVRVSERSCSFNKVILLLLDGSGLFCIKKPLLFIKKIIEISSINNTNTAGL